MNIAPGLAKVIEILPPEMFDKSMSIFHRPAAKRVRANNHTEQANRKLFSSRRCAEIASETLSNLNKRCCLLSRGWVLVEPVSSLENCFGNEPGEQRIQQAPEP